jgi:methylthioribose-1-phosphate isomerase
MLAPGASEPTGEAIDIEMRDGAGLLRWAAARLAPAATQAHNPAFDVTPARLVSALVTESGLIEVAHGHRLDAPALVGPVPQPG